MMLQRLGVSAFFLITLILSVRLAVRAIDGFS